MGESKCGLFVAEDESIDFQQLLGHQQRKGELTLLSSPIHQDVCHRMRTKQDNLEGQADLNNYLTSKGSQGVLDLEWSMEKNAFEMGCEMACEMICVFSLGMTNI